MQNPNKKEKKTWLEQAEYELKHPKVEIYGFEPDKPVDKYRI